MVPLLEIRISGIIKDILFSVLFALSDILSVVHFFLLPSGTALHKYISIYSSVVGHVDCFSSLLL